MFFYFSLVKDRTAGITNVGNSRGTNLSSMFLQELMRDEIPEHDVTYLLSVHLFTYLPLNYDTPGSIFWVMRTVPVTYLMDVGLRKVPCLSSYYPLSVFLAYTSLLSVVSQFIQEAQLTQRDREHTVSWNHVKCCTGVRRIAFKKACNWWMNLKVIQGDCRCCHLIGHILFPISLLL